jgi:hypothetical protein
MKLATNAEERLRYAVANCFFLRKNEIFWVSVGEAARARQTFVERTD